MADATSFPTCMCHIAASPSARSNQFTKSI
jgi:hypothetical protein